MFEWWSGQPGSRAISQQFRLRCDIRCSSATVHEFLCDLHNYEELHPLIETISDIETAADLPDVRRYRVVDRIQFGPLRLRIVYTAVECPPKLDHECVRISPRGGRPDEEKPVYGRASSCRAA